MIRMLNNVYFQSEQWVNAIESYKRGSFVLELLWQTTVKIKNHEKMN